MFGVSSSATLTGGEGNRVQQSMPANAGNSGKSGNSAGVSSSLIESFQSKKDQLNDAAGDKKKKKRRKNRK